MKYLSTNEISKKWGIGQRRIQILCANDRIPGAALVGNTWIIPENAEKPCDVRIKSRKYVKPTVRSCEEKHEWRYSITRQQLLKTI